MTSIPTRPSHGHGHATPPASPQPETARDRLIVALDLESPAANRRLVGQLGKAVSFYKVNWGLLLRDGGQQLLAELLGDAKQVFLDLKIYDVPNTVREAVSAAAQLGARFITVHGNQRIIAAAVEGRGGSALKILAVTVLTSLSEEDVRTLYGLPLEVTLEEHVVRVTRALVDSGCDGVIASPREVAALRGQIPRGVLIASPAIRLPGEPTDDQQRTGYPYETIRAGADYLVVGRSIYEHSHGDPVSQVERYVSEIERGLADRGY